MPDTLRRMETRIKMKEASLKRIMVGFPNIKVDDTYKS